MLVHFERNGEVLYDMWPEKGVTNGIEFVSCENAPTGDTLYDLQGRRTDKYARGLHIVRTADGKVRKVAVTL